MTAREIVERLLALPRSPRARRAGVVVALVLLFAPLAVDKHPYFGVDGSPFFWPAFGAAAGVAAILAARIWTALFGTDKGYEDD